MKILKYNISSIILIFTYLIIVLLFQKVSAYQATHDSFLSLPSHAGFDDAIYITTLQNDRKILVGGEFTTYDGNTANRIIRLFSDGRRDTSFEIGSGFNDAVRAITLQDDGKMIVGGHFTNYNGVTANRIIRLNPDGSVDNSFVTGSGFNAQVRTIALQDDGKMIVGGAIVNYSGTTIYRIVRLNTNGSIDTSFNVGLGFNNNIRSIAFQEDGKIILGGGFLVYSGTTTNRIIRLNPDGSRDTSFVIGSGFNDQINMVVMQSDGKILVGGLFTGYNGTPANKIARLNPNGSIDTSFAIGSGFDIQVVSLITYNDKIIVGGGFASYNGTPINRIVRLNNDGSIDTSFDIGIGYNNVVRSLSVQSDGKILVGGDFTGYQSTSFGHLIRLHGESNISLLNTNNEDAIHAEFLSKGYTLSQSVLSGSAAMVFIDTEGRVPVQLKLKNENILLTLPQDIEIKDSSTMANYTGIFFPPKFIANSKSETIATIQVGSSITGLSLTNGLATISIPVDDAEAGDLVEIFYSEDNGNTWSTHTKTFVNNINGQTYVSFTTNHFTDFAISIPLNMTGSFTINNDDTSTLLDVVTLNISTTPVADQMRFSNDGISWSTRETYATSKSRTLPETYGTKTVYAEFDIDGDNIGDVQTSDDIYYGTIPSGSGDSLITVVLSEGTSSCNLMGFDMSTGVSVNTQYVNDTETLSCDLLATASETLTIISDNLANGSIHNLTANLVSGEGSNLTQNGTLSAGGISLLLNSTLDTAQTTYVKDIYEIGTMTQDIQITVEIPGGSPAGSYTGYLDIILT